MRFRRNSFGPAKIGTQCPLCRKVRALLEWLETALRLRDSGLEYLKTDPLLDPLRKEARFKAIERELKFPESIPQA